MNDIPPPGSCSENAVNPLVGPRFSPDGLASAQNLRVFQTPSRAA
jgi:hypothetical protein